VENAVSNSAQDTAPTDLSSRGWTTLRLRLLLIVRNSEPLRINILDVTFEQLIVSSLGVQEILYPDMLPHWRRKRAQGKIIVVRIFRIHVGYV